MFDPWVELAKYPHIEVRVERLNGSVAGLTNGTDLIWLDDRLNQVERRCVLAHELVHLFMQHTSCQPLMTELIVCQRAARKLITLEALSRVLPWAMCLNEAADELAVTPQTLRDRLQSLSAEESALLDAWEAMRAA